MNLRHRLAFLLDSRPRVARFHRIDGSWFAVDTEGNVWAEQWRTTPPVTEGEPDGGAADRATIAYLRNLGVAEGEEP